jgi:hypothetical protein
VAPVTGRAFVHADGPLADISWSEVTREPSRVIATGDPRWSALLVSGDTVRVFDRTTSKFLAIEVPFPARDITAAVVMGNRLLLGTSGYGVLAGRLE